MKNITIERNGHTIFAGDGGVGYYTVSDTVRNGDGYLVDIASPGVDYDGYPLPRCFNSPVAAIRYARACLVACSL